MAKRLISITSIDDIDKILVVSEILGLVGF